MLHSKDLKPCGTCHFCSVSLDRKEAKFCSRSCNAKYGNKYQSIDQERRAAARIKAYEENPNLCLNCKRPITLEGRSIYDAKRNKFCNKSCSAKYNNSHRNAKYRCKWCGRKAAKWYCNDQCKEKYYIKINKPPKPKRKLLAEHTKKEIFEKAKNYASARSSIQKHAQRVFSEHGSLDKCYYCGSSLGIDVCHVKDVSDFSDASLISEINSPVNLIALCKRHHYEFDNDILSLKEIARAGFAPASSWV